MLIAFTGCDGSGKSTQVQRVKERLLAQGLDVEILDKWDALNPEKINECRFLKSDKELIRQGVSEMEGPSRAMFIFWMIAVTLTKQDLNDPNKIYLLDGYWMKHAAAEIVYGCDQEWIGKTTALMPPPDLVFYFDIDPKDSAQRKPDFSPYECGRDPDCKSENFIAHQGKLRRLLRDWSDRYQWHTLMANQELDEITAKIVAQIECFVLEQKTA